MTLSEGGLERSTHARCSRGLCLHVCRNVKLGCVYVQTVKLRVSRKGQRGWVVLLGTASQLTSIRALSPVLDGWIITDRRSGHPVVVTQPDDARCWVALRDQVSVSGNRLSHQWLLDIYLKAADVGGLKSRFHVGMGHMEGPNPVEHGDANASSGSTAPAVRLAAFVQGSP